MEQKTQGMRLNTKIILFVILITIVPFILIILFLFNFLTQTSLDVETKSLEETTFLIKQDLISSANAKAQIYDMTFKNMIIDLETMKDRFLEKGISSELLTDYYYKHQQISDVYFIDSSGNVYLVSSLGVFRKDKVDSVGIGELDLLSLESEKRYAGLWLGPYISSKEGQKAIAYILPVWKGGRLTGVFGIGITSDILFNDIVRTDPSKSSYVFIVRDNGGFISSSEKIYNDFIMPPGTQDIFDSQVVANQGIIELFGLTSGREGTFTISGYVQESQKIVSFASIPSFSGKIMIVSPLLEIIQVQKEKASELQQAVRSAAVIAFLWMIVLALFIVFFSFFFLQKGIIEPITKLKKGIEHLEDSDFESTIEVKSKDEIGELAADFNDMAKRLKESYEGLEEKVAEKTKQLKELNENLEIKVEEKKKALNDKVKELERLQKVFVGRELTMIELKKKIQALEK